MMTMTRLTAMLLVATCLAAPASAEMRQLNVTFATFSADYAAYLNALEKGYFADEGLEIKITKAGGGVATPALISGTVDLSTSAASSLSAILRGAAIKIVFTMAHRPTYQLWSTEADVKTLNDLKGKSVGIISRGDTFEIAMRLTLLQNNLSQDWVGFTALGSAANVQAAVKSGALPAAILSSGDIDAIKDTNVVKRGHMIADFYKTVRMPYSGVAVSDKFLADNADAVKRFLRASIKGMRYMRAFEQETEANVKKYQPILDDHALVIDYRDVLASLTDDGTASKDEVEKDIEARADIMNLAKGNLPTADQVYDYRLVREVNKELDATGWKPTR